MRKSTRSRALTPHGLQSQFLRGLLRLRRRRRSPGDWWTWTGSAPWLSGAQAENLAESYSAYSHTQLPGVPRRRREWAPSSVDAARLIGLVAGGSYSSPGNPHDVTGTAHKGLRGPGIGLILSNERLLKIIDGAIFPNSPGQAHRIARS